MTPLNWRPCPPPGRERLWQGRRSQDDENQEEGANHTALPQPWAAPRRHSLTELEGRDEHLLRLEIVR